MDAGFPRTPLRHRTPPVPVLKCSQQQLASEGELPLPGAGGEMAGGGDSVGSNGGFRSKVENFLYSGEKKHVLAGIAIIGVVFGAPWLLMNRGTKHQSHQDYTERADKARSQRLSSGQPSSK